MRQSHAKIPRDFPPNDSVTTMMRFATQADLSGCQKVCSMNMKKGKILSAIFVTCGIVLVAVSMFNETKGVEIFFLGLINLVVGSTAYFKQNSRT